MSVKPLVGAVAAAVQARGVPFGDAQVPARDGTKPWIVGWFDAGTYEPRTLVDRGALSVTLTAHCIGLSVESARFAADKLRDALLSLYRVEIDGRTVRYPEQLTALPVARDDELNPPQYDATVEWRIRTT